MANRRMFSLDVVDTDKFLDMPATSQNLYFHLGMRADDDGFVSSPKKITKLVNCGDDDLEVLVSRGFIIKMGDGIVVIRHWKQNNYIQSDRYKPTVYQNQLELLAVDNGVYELDTGCIQDVSKTEAQYSIGKERIEKERKAYAAVGFRTSSHGMKFYEYSSSFDVFWKIYPRNQNKKIAYNAYLERINDSEERFSEPELLQCATAYADYCEKEHIDIGKIMLPSTFLRSSELKTWLIKNQLSGDFDDSAGNGL